MRSGFSRPYSFSLGQRAFPCFRPIRTACGTTRRNHAVKVVSTLLVLTGPEGVPVLSTYSYSLWDDAQKPHEAMAAAMILALMVTIIGVAGLALARRFSRDSGVPA